MSLRLRARFTFISKTKFMLNSIIAFSVRNKAVVGLMVVTLIGFGLYALRHLPIDAVPDITNNQVQVITVTPSLATEEVERFVTTPIELALQNIQQLEEIRSISRFGLSVITVVFDESMDIYLARQLIAERLQTVRSEIPEEWGTPEMGPLTTGLGEIYQYVLEVDSAHAHKFTDTDLRTFQDWIVKRRLSGIEGVVEINSFGGHLKQYEIAVDPDLLKAMSLTMADLFHALANSNRNTGGAYIEKNGHAYYIRVEGLARDLEDLADILVTVRDGRPVRMGDVAEVRYGAAPRYGALVYNGEERVGGRVMMLKGANSAEVTRRVQERVAEIQKSLPDGVRIVPYLVREKLVNATIGTVKKNLLEGGLIVIFILVLMLGNWRAGLIVASVIPLAMLFAITMMRYLGISANLMSLGAIDFGLIVDGAVIIVEAIVYHLHKNFSGQRLSRPEMDAEVTTVSQRIRSSAAFGEIIILMVYIPILALTGIEGKMFKPMAETVMLAIFGALLLSLTYVPMMSALFLSRRVTASVTIADRIVNFFRRLYRPVLLFALRFRALVVGLTLGLFVWSIFVFARLGGEFIPTLEEGDLAMQQILPPGTALSQSIDVAKRIHRILLDSFPEVEAVVTNIGSAEIPTDPMPVEIGDYVIVMKPKKEWKTASTRQAMFRAIEEKLHIIPGLGLEFSQPIQLRFNELMTGSKADIAVKIYGDDKDVLYQKGQAAQQLIREIAGVGSVTLEQTVGMPQLVVQYDYDKLAQYGLQVGDVNRVVSTAFAGAVAGSMYEGERRFDLVVRLAPSHRFSPDQVAGLYIPLASGRQVPLSEVARVRLANAAMQISRDNTHRRIVLGVNADERDVESLVEDIRKTLDQRLDLPAGYYVTFGGQYEHLKAARARLMVAVPIALFIIFVLLYFTFGSLAQALLIYTAIPMSAIGGIWSLYFRGMPFSISAGIGFIALFGVAVLNGIVLIGYLNRLKRDGIVNIRERVLQATHSRLRPVLMTTFVASLGFLPMALSTSNGAEVQRPLATVVIGGLVTASVLTLIVLPILYTWLVQWQENRLMPWHRATWVVLLLAFGVGHMQAQKVMTTEEAVKRVLQYHPDIGAAAAMERQAEALKDLPYVPGRTEFSYEGEGLNTSGDTRLDRIAIRQNLSHPAITRAANKLADARLAQAGIAKRWTTSQIEYHTRELCLSISYQRAMERLYRRFVETYRQYTDIAEKRYLAGEASKSEWLNLSASLRNFELLSKQAAIERGRLERQLGAWTGDSIAITISDSLMVFSPDTSSAADPLLVQQAKAKLALLQAQQSVLQSAVKPNFFAGGFLDRTSAVGPMWGLEAGVALNLFRGRWKKEVEASRISLQTGEKQLAATELRWTQQVLASKAQMQAYRIAIEDYQARVSQIHPELLQIATLHYQTGVISYADLLRSLELILNEQKALIEAIYGLDRQILLYQFLTQN